MINNMRENDSSFWKFAQVGWPTKNCCGCWDFNQFATYEAAIGNGMTGSSTVFTYHVPETGPEQDYFMDGLQAFALVPEPSILTLGGVIGLSCLTVLRRSRRQAEQHKPRAFLPQNLYV